MRYKNGLPWQNVVQKTIFALLFINTCLLAASVIPPFFGRPALFGSNEAPLLAMDLPVQQQTNLLFGNIRLETEQGMTLAQARVLINGQAAGDFSTGSLLLRVYEGDVLSIDATAYQRPLLFKLSAVSSNIDTTDLPPNIYTNGGIQSLPPICFM